jgi:cobyric acid synthase
MTARTLMVQGTASSVGKSLMVAALCRIFRDRGLRVAPFKSQNMALNSAVTADGHEIGRAQAVQARAAGVEPTVHMNPILLKPETDMRAQVVLRGKPVGSMRFGEYHERRPELVAAIRESLATLRAAYDVVVIEGAGSPAEINASAGHQLGVAVTALPHLSNFDDFLPLQRHPRIHVRWADTPRELLRADLVVLPGTKTTVRDLEWLRQRGLDRAIAARADLRLPVLGICGGCQMLGTSIDDPDRVESDRRHIEGLGLLPLRTRFDAAKVTAQVEAKTSTSTFLGPEGIQVHGYFIHMGRTEGGVGREAFELDGGLDGAVAEGGAVVGTMIHGIFESAPLVDGLVRSLLAGDGLRLGESDPVRPDPEAEYNRLAQSVRDAVDIERIIEMMAPARAEEMSPKQKVRP